MFYVGTSWKMNKTRPEARDWIETVLGANDPGPAITRFVVPPFTALHVVAEALADSLFVLGAQTVHAAAKGAHTGDISAPMLAELGCQWVEIGHSERRSAYGESDRDIQAKARAVLEAGMRPLICVGDTDGERQARSHLDTVGRQVRLALADLSDRQRARCLIAYEPVWAIGIGGRVASIDEVAEMHRHLKTITGALPILYGGSVDEHNAAALADTPAVDGLFIGRAALDACNYNRIVTQVADVESVRSRPVETVS